MAKRTPAEIAKAANEQTEGPRLFADTQTRYLLDWLRWNNGGRIAYDDDLEDDPSTPMPDRAELWDEIGSDLEFDDTPRGRVAEHITAGKAPADVVKGTEPRVVRGRLVR